MQYAGTTGRWRRIAATVAGFAAFLVAGTGAHASPVSAGVSIANTASASYVDSATGLNVRLVSNTVATVVQPSEALLLSSSQSAGSSPSNGFVVSHQLTNSGNVPTTYALTIAFVSGGFTPAGLELIQDINSNGVADPGEPVIANGGTVTLAAGAVTNVLVIGSVPAGASAGQSAQLRISAVSQGQGARAANTDTINVLTGPIVTVTKSASSAAPQRSDSLAYTLTAQNSGTSPAVGVAVTVNGSPQTLFLLRDAIPANTTYSASVPAASSELLFHRIGDPPSSFVTVAPPSDSIDVLAWGLAALPVGGTLTGRFTVLVNNNAAGVLSNTGFADFNTQGADMTVASNPVSLPLPAFAPTVSFYTSSAYAAPAQEAALGAPLFVQINAAQCNTNPSAVVTHPITLSSELTGDTETYTATEVAANTGIFRILPSVPTANAAGSVTASGNGVLSVLPNDRVTASLTGCGVAAVFATVLIDPSGIVFDSKSNEPIAGATVQLIDVSGGGNGGKGGAPAVVFDTDGVTPAPSIVTTGIDGRYRFPFVLPSNYRLVVVPPNGYVFPSKLPVGLLPANRQISNPASYGGNFPLTVKGGALMVDVPLDTGAAGGLFVQKIASKTVAALGDFVDYTISINNGTGIAMPGIVVDDSLPAGFAFIAGSARLNGAALANPDGGSGPALAFKPGTLQPGMQSVVQYRVRIGPSAESGTGTNTARARSGLTQSNLASATVQVSGGALSDKAYLIGKVFADCNGNRVQDRDERGVPGVRVYLDNGTFAVTDIDGKYSLYDLTPRTTVAKIDPTTLPTGARLEVLDNRNAGDPASRFVDLRNGELGRGDFALAGCTAGLIDQIAARRKSLQGQTTEIAAAAAAQIKLNPSVASDARTLPASGLIGQPSAAHTDAAPAAFAPVMPAFMGAKPVPQAIVAGAQPARAAMGTEAVPLGEILPTASSQAAFIDLRDGQVVPMTQTRVRVKGPAGTQLRLIVNESILDVSQVGERSTLESRGVEAWEYVGVNLAPGDNTLELVVMDDFGIRRGSARIRLIAPGRLAQILIDAPKDLHSDVQQPVDVTVRLLDDKGVPVTSRTALTLDSSLGDWLTRDLDPKEPGTQVFIEGGVGHFELIPPANPGKAVVRATSGMLQSEAELTFLPNLRPMLAAGLVEGVLSLSNLNPKQLVAPQNGDGFEREIRSVSQSFDSGKGAASGRASMFLKGKILGADLLTLSYDSDKPGDTALLRDIQPDQFYPVYGDSSVKGFEAQSTSKLYVRIDRGTSYAMYGDYSTQSDNPARLLTQYSRALNGAKTHVEDGALTVDAFVSYTNSTQVIDEIPANGTSGPYQLSGRNPVLNSQRVDIVTRDRNQPSIVLSDVTMTQFADYAVDPFSAQILFKAPIPSLDANLNPVYIRIGYEVSNGGASYWLGGADLREKVASDLTLGGTYIRDTNPVDHGTLGGVNFLWAPNKDTSLVGEFARSESDLIPTGYAGRIELRHTDRSTVARLYAVQSDASFYNPNSTFNGGAREYGAKVSHAFDERNRVIFEALKTLTAAGTMPDPLSIPVSAAEAAATGSTSNGSSSSGAGEREGESLALEHAFANRVKLTAGVRHAKSNEDPTQSLAAGAVPNEFTSARARIDTPVPGFAKANVFTQYEQAVDSSGRRDTTVGGTYQVSSQTKFYATHQSSNSLTGDYGLNPSQQNMLTVVGIDTAYMENAKLFNEYRVNDGIDGRSADAAVGLRNLWAIAPGLGLSTSVQQVHPISGPVTDRATALTGALAYTASQDWKGTTRVEWSRSSTSQTWLTSAGGAVRIDADVTALARGVYNEQSTLGSSSPAAFLRQAQLGFAYRPVDNDVWNALAWIEHKHSANGAAGPGLATDEAADILSTNLNYQVNAGWTLDGRYAIKRAVDYSQGFQSDYTAQVIGGRSTWDLNRKWDLGLQYFVELGGGGASTRQQAAGAEAGYLVMNNLWLSFGYNVVGFVDADLASEDYTQRSFYLRLRMKFDENLFKPKNNAEPIPAGSAVMK